MTVVVASELTDCLLSSAMALFAQMQEFDVLLVLDG